MGKKQYIIPTAEWVVIQTENTMQQASGEDYNSHTGSWG